MITPSHLPCNKDYEMLKFWWKIKNNKSAWPDTKKVQDPNDRKWFSQDSFYMRIFRAHVKLWILFALEMHRIAC